MIAQIQHVPSGAGDVESQSLSGLTGLSSPPGGIINFVEQGLRGPKRSEHSHSAGAFRRSKKPPSPDAEGVQLVSSGLSMAASSRSPRLSLVMARNASPRPKTRSSSAGRSAATPCGRGTSGSPLDRPQVRHGPADSDDLPTTAKCQPVPIARLLSSRIWRDVLFRIELRAAQEFASRFLSRLGDHSRASDAQVRLRPASTRRWSPASILVACAPGACLRLAFQRSGRRGCARRRAQSRVDRDGAIGRIGPWTDVARAVRKRADHFDIYILRVAVSRLSENHGRSPFRIASFAFVFGSIAEWIIAT